MGKLESTSVLTTDTIFSWQQQEHFINCQCRLRIYQFSLDLEAICRVVDIRNFYFRLLTHQSQSNDQDSLMSYLNLTELDNLQLQTSVYTQDQIALYSYD